MKPGRDFRDKDLTSEGNPLMEGEDRYLEASSILGSQGMTVTDLVTGTMGDVIGLGHQPDLLDLPTSPDVLGADARIATRSKRIVIRLRS